MIVGFFFVLSFCAKLGTIVQQIALAIRIFFNIVLVFSKLRGTVLNSGQRIYTRLYLVFLYFMWVSAIFFIVLCCIQSQFLFFFRYTKRLNQIDKLENEERNNKRISHCNTHRFQLNEEKLRITIK